LTLNTEKFYRCADITKDYIIKMHLWIKAVVSYL
jgi:hypothetical protein